MGDLADLGGQVGQHPGLYKPDYVNPRYETDTAVGDFDGAFAAAAVRVDATYRTPAEHNHPMEPHATIAVWQGDTLTLYDATQGPTRAASQIAAVFALEPGGVRVIAEHVGGGFGAKGMPRANVVLAAMAARVIGRPVRGSARSASWAPPPRSPMRCTTPPESGSATCPSGWTSCSGRFGAG